MFRRNALWRCCQRNLSKGSLTRTDTGAVRVLKVVDDYHDTSEVKEGTTRGQVQNLTANSITIKSKRWKNRYFPDHRNRTILSGRHQSGNWVYLHYKGDFGPASADDPNVLDGSQMKIYSVSDIDRSMCLHPLLLLHLRRELRSNRKTNSGL